MIKFDTSDLRVSVDEIINDAVGQAIHEAAQQAAAEHSATATVYTKPSCQYCTKAKTLLDKRGVVYVEIDIVGEDAEETERNRQSLIETVTAVTGTAPRTMPQIFLGATYIGGYDDLVKHFAHVDAVAAEAE